jgi:hypothetical protein
MIKPVALHFVGKDLIWSLKPIILLMKAIGINIKGQGISKSSNFVKRCLIYMYSLAWLVLSFSCFIATSCDSFDKATHNTNSNTKRSSTFVFSLLIDREAHSGKNSNVILFS